MKLSEKKRSALYSAISEPIMDERIMTQKHGSPSSDQLDIRLFDLQRSIWLRVHGVLNLEGPA